MDFNELEMINAINLLQPDCYTQFDETIYKYKFPNPEVYTIKKDLFDRQSEEVKDVLETIIMHSEKIENSRGWIKEKNIARYLSIKYGYSIYSKKVKIIINKLRDFLLEMKI